MAAPAPVATPAAPSPDDRALAMAASIVADTSARLQARMTQEMHQSPPDQVAVDCSIEASALTQVVPDGSSAHVGRASLRLRNPENSGPPWVQAWLQAQGERPMAGVAGFARVEDTPEGRVARVLRPIPVMPHCLTCHGDEATLSAEVRGVLRERYPDDQATGYAAGDLRGALWAEVPVGS